MHFSGIALMNAQTYGHIQFWMNALWVVARGHCRGDDGTAHSPNCRVGISEAFKEFFWYCGSGLFRDSLLVPHDCFQEKARHLAYLIGNLPMVFGIVAVDQDFHQTKLEFWPFFVLFELLSDKSH